jgi:hypothetical protein
VQLAVEVPDQDRSLEEIKRDEVAGVSEVSPRGDGMPRGKKELTEFRAILLLGEILIGSKYVAKVVLIREHR